MNHLFAFVLLLVGAASASAGLNCQLDAQDYRSLALLEEPITPETIGSMPQKDLDNLCMARSFLRKVRSGHGDTVTAIPKRHYLYLTNPELAEVGPTVARVLADRLRTTVFKKA